MDRRRILLVAAVLVAALGVGLVFVYAQGANNRAQSKVETTDVLVATQEIPAGMSASDAYNQGMIKIASVPSSAVLPTATADGERFKNLVALTNIYSGEQLLPAKFGTIDQVDVIARLPVPTGQTAVTVALTDTDRLGDFTVAGSRVGMLLTGTIAPSTVPETRVLLSKVTILAVGGTPLGTSATTDNSSTSVGNLPNTDYTIAVSPQDALRVRLAETLGTLSLVALAPNEKLKVGDSVSGGQLFGNGH